MSAEHPVVTGLGTVGATGWGAASLRSALAEGTPLLTQKATYLAALVDPLLDVGKHLPPLEARRMSPPSQFAVIAARSALEDAGLEIAGEPDPGIAVATASAFGPSSYTQLLLDQMLDAGPSAASPSLFTECVANAPAARIALACRACGPNRSVVQGEAGPLGAVACGAADVARGRARFALVGAVEEMTPFVLAALDRFHALSPNGSARPFDRGRDGCLAAEGATLLVLETEHAAKQRGARLLARLRGAWSAFDPTAPASGWGRGAGPLARRLLHGLERCGLAPDGIDLVVSGASGSRAGDRLEAETLRRAWGGRPLPPVVAPKATTGEYGGAFLGAAVLAAAGAPFGPTHGFEEVDPALGVRPHDGRPLPPARHVLVTSLATGGAASWLVLERP